MKQNLNKLFENYKKRVYTDINLKPAAVLIPLFYIEDYLHVLLTQRSETVIHHKGQICFPGGSYQSTDATLRQTALRETEEEIGLVANHVEVIGELDDSSTFTSRYVISPFVALIPYPYPFQPNYNEIKQIISVPLSILVNETKSDQPYPSSDKQYRNNYHLNYQEHVIWGVTARILIQLIDLFKLRSGTYV